MFTAVVLVVSSCTEAPEEPKDTVPRGGTLIVNAFISQATLFSLDPHIAFAAQPWELFRCCLLRTLLAYPGRPAGDGGARLRPDLAESLPELSTDALTWTFRLRRGLRYGPPFTDTEILAPDIVRALERAASRWEAGGYLYEPIEGFTDVTEGKAESISGLETPDDHTLVVHLTHPSGDIGQLMALPASAPIPPVPNGMEFGAADGHEDYGPFLVSSGPYMFDGAGDLDFTSSPEEQTPARGYEPDGPLILVRNPSWRPGSDRLRPAYPDRIEVKFVDSVEAASEGVVLGEADIVLVARRPPQVPADIVEEYQGDPALQDRLVFGPRDVMIYLSMNLATPPFDDVHVRKAVNLAVDKATLLDNMGGRAAGDLIGHVVLDSFEDNLLHDYDPYATPEGRGDAERARDEMAQSAYDHDGDGICDDPVCRDVLAVAPVFGETPTQEQAESIRSNLEALGIQLDVQVLDPEEAFTRLYDPSAQVAVGIELGWGKDFPSPSAWVSPLFTAEGIGGGNVSLVGADQESLREWGYQVTSVPSIEEKATECRPLFGDEATRCYAELDQQLMEQVVPWVPLRVENQAFIVSRRVVSTSYDQFTSLPALDRVALSRPR
ncbi:MAG TPA: ABC transporter substrate-binding protein [Actinomycetota bacterium]